MNEHLLIMLLLLSIGASILLLYCIARLLSIRSTNVDNSIKSQKLADALLRLDNIILGAVNTTNQRVVNHLKKTGNFFQLDKDEAFNQTKWHVLNTIREQDMNELAPYFSDINEWINNRIEYYVKMEKNK